MLIRLGLGVQVITQVGGQCLAVGISARKHAVQFHDPGEPVRVLLYEDEIELGALARIVAVADRVTQTFHRVQLLSHL